MFNWVLIKGRALLPKKDLRKLEQRLRNERPSPPPQLMHSLAPQRRQRRQFAFAVALTAGLAVSLAAVGGVSYAATTVQHVAKAAARIVAPEAHHRVYAIQSRSSGGDEYRPGYGFGDENHNHTGPPGLDQSGASANSEDNQGANGQGANGQGGNGQGGNGQGGNDQGGNDQTGIAPPQADEIDSKGTAVATSITVDEQAALYFSVLDSDGVPLLLTQKGSRIGAGLTGPQVKSIHYVMLVPHTLDFALRVPSNLLVAGETYSIRVIAVDHEGNKTKIILPFKK